MTVATTYRVIQNVGEFTRYMVQKRGTDPGAYDWSLDKAEAWATSSMAEAEKVASLVIKAGWLGIRIEVSS